MNSLEIVGSKSYVTMVLYYFTPPKNKLESQKTLK